MRLGNIGLSLISYELVARLRAGIIWTLSGLYLARVRIGNFGLSLISYELGARLRVGIIWTLSGLYLARVRIGNIGAFALRKLFGLSLGFLRLRAGFWLARARWNSWERLGISPGQFGSSSWMLRKRF